MKFVVDTNIVFAFFKRDSFTSKLIERVGFALVAPDFLLAELDVHQHTIQEKCGLTKHEYAQRKNELAQHIVFVPVETYASHLAQAQQITPDLDDIDFVALALAQNCALWTNDKALHTITELLVVSTADLAEEYW